MSLPRLLLGFCQEEYLEAQEEDACLPVASRMGPVGGIGIGSTRDGAMESLGKSCEQL